MYYDDCIDTPSTFTFDEIKILNLRSLRQRFRTFRSHPLLALTNKMFDICNKSMSDDLIILLHAHFKVTSQEPNLITTSLTLRLALRFIVHPWMTLDLPVRMLGLLRRLDLRAEVEKL